MRIAAVMALCEGELAIATDAAASLNDACAGGEICWYLVDDKSPSRVGQRLAELLRREGYEAHCVELSQRLGFRGCISRSFLGLRMVVESGFPADLVIKLDADSLFVRNDLQAFLAMHCWQKDRAWGVVKTMRMRDRILLLADLLPLGFRRQRGTDGTLERNWELSRLRSVWWADIGYRAIFHGFRFRHFGGPCYMLGGQTLQKIAQAGFLERVQEARHGFLTSEEDVMMTLAVMAVGTAVTDLRQIHPRWGEFQISPRTSLDKLAADEPFLVHPLKANPSGDELRERVRSAFGLKAPLWATANSSCALAEPSQLK